MPNFRVHVGLVDFAQHVDATKVGGPQRGPEGLEVKTVCGTGYRASVVAPSRSLLKEAREISECRVCGGQKASHTRRCSLPEAAIL